MPKLNFKQPGQKALKMAIELDFKRVNIGRAESNDIVLTNPSISSNHCHLLRVKGGFRLVDNDSTNGVKVEDKRCDVIDLNTDIEFYIGDVLVQCGFTDKEYETLDSEGEFESKQKPKLPPL